MNIVYTAATRNNRSYVFLFNLNKLNKSQGPTGDETASAKSLKTAHLYCSQAKSYGREKKHDKKNGGMGGKTKSKDVGCGGQANGSPDMHMNVSSGERVGGVKLRRQIRNEGVKPTAVPRPRLIKWNDANGGLKIKTSCVYYSTNYSNINNTIEDTESNNSYNKLSSAS